ncbi:hypothetical protein AK812_SmicGene22305 [Symbiodinium microadriaticum]|uniref:Nucleolar protein 12 n=1 Tax=Symbiodinium microadriaticum TaxID=2951 RepID=A0A1Q9DK53_SYMMI|nr:hypothetical protein AK812_SmicGene22305 [Symbiodinium microadriaticum]
MSAEISFYQSVVDSWREPWRTLAGLRVCAEDMVKQRRAKRDSDQVLTFDPASRQSFLAGFRKRKQDRRKWAVREILEKERQDRIEAKKDHRQDVKQRWKDLQRAEKRVEALLGPAEEVGWLGDLRSEKLKDEEVPVTVAFEAEEDDPFGDCEVTTTIAGVSDGAGRHLPLALVGKSGNAISVLGGQAGLLRDLTGIPQEDPQARSKRRFISSEKEESRRQTALDETVSKKLNTKNQGPKKKSKRAKGSKQGKRPVGRKERRKRMKRRG